MKRKPVVNRTRAPRLNPYKPLALAVLMSTLTALAVLFSLRLRNRPATPQPADNPSPAETNGPSADSQVEIASTVQPAVSAVQPAEVPHHFSEDLIVPGLTHTGPEIAEQDVEEGQSPDGV